MAESFHQKQAAPLDPDDRGIGPVIMGITWLLTVVCIGAVGFRFYLRQKFAGGFSSDDWLMFAAFVFQLFYQAFQTEAYTYGLGKAHYNLYYDENIKLQKWLQIILTFGIVVAVLARLSIAILLIRIFGTKRAFKLFTICVTGIEVINGILAIIFGWASVSPVDAIWDVSIPARRWDPRISQYTGLILQALFTVTDVILVVWPSMIIWKLNMSPRRKLGLCLLIATSLITAGASLAKVVVSCFLLTQTAFVGGNGTFDYAAGLIQFCSSIEQALVIILGCVPTLHRISKLRVPTMHDIGSSISSFVSKVRRRPSASTLSTQNASDLSGTYQNLELTPKNPMLQDEKGFVRGINVTANPSKHSLSDEGHIRRTDSYSLTYSQGVNPKNQ